MVILIIGIALGALIAYNKWVSINHSFVRSPDRDFPGQWRNLLEQKIEFYQRLDKKGRNLFEKKVHVFLLNVRVLGIGTKVTDEDRMLVASSAVIPIFGFQDWHYFNLSEVHVHPTKFKIPGQDKYARGLIGWGGMDGIMKLSRKALHEGFQEENLIKEIDIMPWLHLMHQEMSEIKAGQSTIREYGAANRAEFLAVAGEYFFESPEKMKAEHPALYTALDSMFNPKVTPKADKFKYTKKYDPCPCGSGRKFSKCCLKNAANY
jgi:Mlc titration factor MtfA (ptsG expression regulator)